MDLCTQKGLLLKHGGFEAELFEKVKKLFIGQGTAETNYLSSQPANNCGLPHQVSQQSRSVASSSSVNEGRVPLCPSTQKFAMHICITYYTFLMGKTWFLGWATRIKQHHQRNSKFPTNLTKGRHSWIRSLSEWVVLHGFWKCWGKDI